MNCELCNSEIEEGNKLCKYCSNDIKTDYKNNPEQYKKIAEKYGVIIKDE